MPALNRLQAEERAQEWVAGAAPGAEPVLYEFALGWVISARFPPSGYNPEAGNRLGVPNMVLDRESGELVVGGTLPPSHIAEWYSQLGQPRPAVAGPRQYPATLSQLTIADRSWTALSLRSDTDQSLHPIVATFFAAMPAEYRERGCDRASEAAVFSAFFMAEDAARAAAGRPALEIDEAREIVRGARVRTFRVREDADPTSGQLHRSRLPVLLFLDYLGLDPDAAR